MTLPEALELIIATEFNAFTKEDHYSFGGIESANPKIGYNKSLGLTLIIDGSELVIFDEEGDEISFKLVYRF